MLFPVILLVIATACSGNGTDGEAAGQPGATTSRPMTGADIYNAQCTLCHGRDGKLGLSGAKDLTLSTLSREEMIALVTHGKGAMAGYAVVLAPSDIEAVVDHVRSLPKAG